MTTASYYAGYETSPVEVLSPAQYLPRIPYLPYCLYNSTEDLFEYVAAVTLINGVGSNSVVKIKRIHVQNNGTGDSRLGSALTVQDISAMSGGYSLNIIPHDTAGAAVPAQVTAACQPTITAGYSSFRRTLNIPLQNPYYSPYAAGGFIVGEIQGINDIDTTKIISTGYLDQGQTQSIRLAAGTGIALIDSSNYPITYQYNLMCMFKIGTDTYRIMSQVASSGRAGEVVLFGLMNGAGSGVNVDILKICLRDTGSADPSLWSIARLENDNFSGSEITPVALDSANSIPSQIKIYREQVVHLAGQLQGAVVPCPYLRRFHANGAGGSISFNNATRLLNLAPQIDQIDTEIILREGQAIGIFKASSSGVGLNQFELMFNVETEAPAGGGGEHSYAFSC